MKKKKKKSKKRYNAKKLRLKKIIKNVKKRKKKKKSIKVKKKSKKRKLVKKFRIPNIQIKTKKLNVFKKISLQGFVNFVLNPFFTAYENFREKRRIQKLKKIALEKAEKERKIKEERRLRYEAKKQLLKDEQRLAKEREVDLKRFLRQEQAILRREQAKKRKEFLEEIRLEKKIEAFRKREFEEIKNLEKLALKEQREDYKQVEERIEKIKEKYRLIREQKIRERVESLGVEISDLDTREDLLKKEKEYAEHRHKIEIILESFYRSANSLVFQLNKKYIPKHKSILRVIDRRYESNECFIRYDDSPDEDWLVLIYLEDSDAKKGKIVVENKTNPEKHETKSFETKEIFNYSDYLVDTMTSHIDRERQKKDQT
mgnify:CR=1 FL=1|tara:strand:- start:353 stop:1468 length:1116 start_codon:yes stop_codon:yes gene_type:complete